MKDLNIDLNKIFQIVGIVSYITSKQA